MSKTSALKPAKLEVDINCETTSKLWKHWKRTFDNFLAELAREQTSTAPPINKLQLLTNFVSAEIFEFIEDCNTYDSAVEILQNLLVKKPNEIFARHLLATRKQQPSESPTQFMQTLQILSKNCQCKDVTAEQYRKELCRDAFINGLASPSIRQRLLENTTLSLESAVDQANALDMASKNASAYSMHSTTCSSASTSPQSLHSKNEIENRGELETTTYIAASFKKKKCYFCGYDFHDRRSCPARNLTCNKCGKIGHFLKVCKSKYPSKTVATVAKATPTLCAIYPHNLLEAALMISIRDQNLCALVDSGSSDNYINAVTAKSLNLPITPTRQEVSMAQSSLRCTMLGSCTTNIVINNRKYEKVQLGVMDNLCSDVILGQAFQKRHNRLIIKYGGIEEDFTLSKPIVCALPAATIAMETLFPQLPKSCKPIAVKSRRYSKPDEQFIREEINKMQDDGVIELSRSPWRAQIVVVRTEGKTRMCVDYSQTINIYTHVDAYPFPRIDDLINKLAKYSVFSKFDLKSAYHQIPILETDRVYTAFEANGKLWQYKRIPYGVTNGGINFQRAIDRIIDEENLNDVFAYQDDVTVCGRTQQEHDDNVQKLLSVFKRRNLTFNESKTVKSVSQINVLGYQVQHKTIKPDPDRLQPLQEYTLPQNKKALQRLLGFLSYYSKWIPRFSDKVKPLTTVQSFPLSEEAEQAFHQLLTELATTSLQSIDETTPFVVECDASDVAISASLNQGGRPVAFMSRMLHGSELKYPAIEKEATAIIEATRKWKDLLQRQSFELVTDQRSVAYMLDNRRRTKIKNNKIQTWRLELAPLNYSIRYRPGKMNPVADCLSRSTSASIYQPSQLEDIHNNLGHPGVTRMLHFIRMKNLPFSTDEIRKVCSNCKICAENKPRFYRPPQTALIKATKPMERISIDFKGPIPSSSKNKYILTIIDEYSRFPFAVPCPNMNSTTVIQGLNQLFTLTGLPSYIHSDRVPSLISHELRTHLRNLGIATSSSTPYHPTGNSQVERYNGIIWKTVTLILKSRKLPLPQWELVLPEALHSIRSLLCTASNVTPHQRFFSFDRRSTSGPSMPSWLIAPNKVYLRRFVRNSKYDPLVDEVELIDTNPTYARVRRPDGQESTVSLNDLSPCPQEAPNRDEIPVAEKFISSPSPNIEVQNEAPVTDEPEIENMPTERNLRRSSRTNKGVPPARYGEQ
ncbi:uncharacterized protein LOC143461082 [Clavelina lepadiformis]|uniref:uncharacterized protein LOC143461082 n=1 Tax=Clavelina lepadiformis TaxID=159417 RepID=UPI0040428176